MHTGSWKQHSKHHHQQWAPSTFDFVIFPHFIAFSFSMATLSIFGNMHYTLKSLPNIITNSAYFFLWNFPYFITSLHLQKHPFPYLEVHSGPWKQCPMVSPAVSTTAELTNAPHSPAWVIATYAKKWQVFCWNEDPWHPDRPEKYILTTSLSQNIF